MTYKHEFEAPKTIEELVKKYRHVVREQSQRATFNKSDVDDIESETWLNLIGSWKQNPGLGYDSSKGSFRCLFLRISWCLVLQATRKRSNRLNLSEFAANSIQSCEHEPLSRDDKQEELYRAIGKLEGRERELVERILAGEDKTDIRIEGTSERTTYRIADAAIESLREIMFTEYVADLATE